MTCEGLAVRLRRRPLVTRLLLVLAVLCVAAGCTSSLKLFPPHDTVPPSILRGVNVYTLEQNRALADPHAEIGEPESSYIYLASQGVTTVRLAVPWGSLQPVAQGEDPHAALDQPIDQQYLTVVEREVAKIAKAGLFTVLDLHNGCAYPQGPSTPPAGELYCGPGGITKAQAEHVWLALSDAFRTDTSVVAYDLFNEPHAGRITDARYRSYISAVVGALRQHGDTHRIWVEALLGERISVLAPTGGWVADPLNRITYSAHFYPNYHLFPGYAPIPDRNRGSFLAGIRAFGTWCTTWHVRCSIGELGWPGNDASSVDNTDANFWNTLGNDAYNLADKYRMDVTYFGASSANPSALWAYAYGSAGKGDCPKGTTLSICASFSQASVLRAHASG